MKKDKDYANLDLNNLDWKKYKDTNQGYIYVITNTINGMKYVGQTNNPYSRWKRHISTAKNKSCTFKSYLYSAMEKYGIINFTFEVIEICSLNLVNEREIFWIQKLNTNVPYGYNITKGGGALYQEDNPFYGKQHSEETKKKISQKNKGRKWTEKQRKKMREINLGENNPFYHREHNEETKLKIKEKNKKNGLYDRLSLKMQGNQYFKNIKRKKVAMISMETNEVLRVFDSAVLAGEYIQSLGLCKTKKTK